MNWVQIWFYKGVGEFLFEVCVIILITTIYLLFQMQGVIKQKICKHDKYFENSACNAVCLTCRKDLGFIGKWREVVK